MKATYIDHMGTDLSVVNAARVSFGKRSDWLYPGLKEGLDPKDVSLIQFLARGCTSGDWSDILLKASLEGSEGLTEVGIYGSELEDILNYVRRMPTHWTPFGHTAITLHIKAPIFVARQLGKHQVGMVWNEVSRRYVDDEPEFYTPEVWRKRADNVKQGSSTETVDIPDIQQIWDAAYDWYADLLCMGVAPEQARMVLPQSMYTEWYWTGNLQAFANVFLKRTDPHTQRETQDVVRKIGQIISPLFPVSWEALTNN